MASKLEYIMSGTSYTRMHTSETYDDTELFDVINKIFRKVHELTDHNFGLLYNAFTESNFGKNIVRLDSINSIHADSGGLQIITQGLTVTDEIKDKIYKNQAQFADLGMCFDEIPINVIGGISARMDTSNRIFDINLLEPKARETGRNITRQIEIFLEEKSKCKPILIAQGNCYDTYMKWVDYILDEIPSDMHQYIGGVAMGGAALGTGMLEDIERAFIYSQLPIEKTHLHILGVGSMRRLLPYIAFIKNGLYGDISISYDSTTHSSGIELGNYYTESKMRSYNRNFGKIYETMYNDHNNVYNTGIDIKEFFKILNMGRIAYNEQGGDDIIFRATRIATLTASVINFCRQVDGTMRSSVEFDRVIGSNKSLHPLKGLENVLDLKSYNEWKKHVGRFIKSDRIKSIAPSNNLEDFFI